MNHRKMRAHIGTAIRRFLRVATCKLVLDLEGT